VDICEKKAEASRKDADKAPLARTFVGSGVAFIRVGKDSHEPIHPAVVGAAQAGRRRKMGFFIHTVEAAHS
jgi:hypothetical protein